MAPGRRAILLGPVARAGKELGRAIRALNPGPRDYLIGVDGGTATWFKLLLTPSVAVGDWDSLRDRSVLARVRHLDLPHEKNESDLFHALAEAAQAGAVEVICLGVTAGRADHHLASLLELARAAASGRFRSVRAIGPEAEYHFLSAQIPSLRLGPLKRGQPVSVFSLGGPARGVVLEGFRYRLDSGGILSPGSRGLSNEAQSVQCRVEVRTGRLVVIVPRVATRAEGSIRSSVSRRVR